MEWLLDEVKVQMEILYQFEAERILTNCFNDYGMRKWMVFQKGVSLRGFLVPQIPRICLILQNIL